MSILEGVLIEESKRVERNISNYQNMLNSLPRGSIFIRKMGNSSFAYRKYKENGRVISIYLGNVKEAKVRQEIELSNDYKRIRKNIAVAKNELAKLRKVINFYGK